MSIRLSAAALRASVSVSLRVSFASTMLKPAYLIGGKPPELKLTSGRAFIESEAKLYWSRLYAYNLSANWKAVVEYDGSAAKRVQANPIDGTVHFATGIPIPIELGMMLGDCVRALRSALDYLISKMARDVGLADNNMVFPFASKRESLEASFNPPKPGDQHRKARRAGALYDLSGHYPKLQEVILDRIQPYDAADGASALGDMLRRVVTADNVDKHRIIMPSASILNTKRLRTGGITFYDIGFIGNHRLPIKSDTDYEGTATADMLFQEPTLLAGKPILRTLVEAADFVEEVIGIFEREFFFSDPTVPIE